MCACARQREAYVQFAEIFIIFRSQIIPIILLNDTCGDLLFIWKMHRKWNT